MHDARWHQAQGLMGLRHETPAQLTAMVSHGDEKSELPLLWQLCSAWVDLGYPVTVLDGTKVETEDNPGLLHLLEARFGATRRVTDPTGWTIVPALQGIQSLCNLSADPTQQLQNLGDLFADGGVVMLYTGVDAMVRLLGGTRVRPLLTVSGERNALVTSYSALKRLLLKGHLEPTILNMMQGSAAQASDAPTPVATTLRDCAKNFLGYELNTIPIPAADTATSLAQLRRLVLRQLEGALPLTRPPGPSPLGSGFPTMRLFSRSH